MVPLSSQWAIVAGVGPGTGGSIARKFAQEYPVILLSRSTGSYEPLVAEINEAGGRAVGLSMDASSPASIDEAFKEIRTIDSNTPSNASALPVAAAVLNGAGGFAIKPFLEISQQEFDSSGVAAMQGAFHFSQAVLPHLLAAAQDSQSKYPPTLIFTGATAALKASAKFASFAAGKFAVRAISQSLAREFGPQGVHVAHAIIDGIIDTARTANYGPSGTDTKLQPDAVSAIQLGRADTVFEKLFK